MLQHVLLGDLAPLCLLAGLTGPLLRPLLALRPGRAAARARAPAVALPLWAVNLYVWHLPFLYEAAVAHAAVHALEHVCFFTAGADHVAARARDAAGAGVVRHRRRSSPTSPCVRVVETVLGNVFVWSGTVFYAVYARGEELWGISPLHDQGLAGAVMMIEGSLVTIAALAWLFLRLARGGRAAAGAARARARPARRPARRALRPRAGAGPAALNSSSTCARPASTTSTSSSPRSSGACPSTATCSARSATTASRRSRASAARRSGTSAGRAARSGCGRRRALGGLDRYRVGLHHLAFEAGSRAVVDERHGWLVDAAPRSRAAAGVRLLARLLRRLLLRPGRDQARDRPRAGLRRLRASSYATGADGPSTFSSAIARSSPSARVEREIAPRRRSRRGPSTTTAPPRCGDDDLHVQMIGKAPDWIRPPKATCRIRRGGLRQLSRDVLGARRSARGEASSRSSSSAGGCGSYQASISSTTVAVAVPAARVVDRIVVGDSPRRTRVDAGRRACREALDPVRLDPSRVANVEQGSPAVASTSAGPTRKRVADPYPAGRSSRASRSRRTSRARREPRARPPTGVVLAL